MKKVTSILSLLLVSSMVFANSITTSPASFGDLEKTAVFTELSGSGVIQIYGSQAKKIFESLQVQENDMSDFPGTKEKITADQTTRCWQETSQNFDYQMVLKTVCSIKFSKK